MLTYTDEDYHQMNLEDYFNANVKPALFAVSRVFAEAHKQMTVAEYKTFAYALSQLKWKEACPDTIYLDKKILADIVGITSDIDHLSTDLNRSIGKMPNHSFLRFADKDKDLYVNGNFIRTVVMFKNKVRIKLEEDFLGLFGKLDTNYITMWSGDIFRMKTERAILFYELLRDNTDTRLPQNEGTISIRKFKEMYEIPIDGKGSYMTKDGHFARTHFERYVIDPVCDEISKTKMIKLILQPNGKYYEKVKNNGRVIAYKFYWTISAHPAVADAEEVKQIQERVDKDPMVLKVAKDLLQGEKKPKKNGFNQFKQHETDYDELENLLDKQFADN